MTRINFHPVAAPLRTLSPANDTVQAGRYQATTLSAVDTDLAAANIKDGITLFGVEGSYSQVAAEDSLADERSAHESNTSGTRYHFNQAIEPDADFDIASVDDTFDNALVVGVAIAHAFCNGTDECLKLQLIMDGVTVAESPFIDNMQLWMVMGTKALDGLKTCICRCHNYGVGAENLNVLGRSSGAAFIAAGIAVGGIKVS